MVADALYSYSKGYGDSGYGKLGKYYMRLTLGKYFRKGPFEDAKIDAQKYIYLPLPMEMRDDTAIGFNNVDTGLLGNILDNGMGAGSNYAAEALRQSGSIIKGIGSNVMGGISQVASRAPFISAALNGGASIIDDALPAESITSALSQSMGVSANPNPSVIFQGPRLREINLNWVFMPTCAEDSKNIRRVVNYLKSAALPKNSIKDAAAILEYPYLARVNFYPWDSGGDSPYYWSDRSIIRMKHCFMSSVNVNYTAGNIPAFFEGTNEPIAVGLSINFIEAEYFLSNDYDSSVNKEASDNLIQYITDRLTGAAKKVGVSDADVSSALKIVEDTTE